MKSAIFACILSLVFGALLAFPADSDGDNSKILAMENAWNMAQLNHDSKALDNLVSDTFVYTDYDGTVMNKARFLQDVHDPDYQATLVTNEEQKVFSYKNAAVVVGTYHTKGTYKGKSFDHRGRFTDTWVLEDGIWHCAASHTTLVSK